MTHNFKNEPEIHFLSKQECTSLAELAFAYLATTIGPAYSRGSHLWTSLHRKWLTFILRRSYLSPAVSGAAMHFIGRLKQRQPELELNARAGLNMFIAALVVADKCINDRAISGKQWVNIIKDYLTLPQLMKLEIEFLEAIQWDTTLPQKVFDDFDVISVGWAYMREQLYPADFFERRRWDNIRPPAFDFFDGYLEKVYNGNMYTPFGEWDHWGDPIVYSLEPSLWNVPLDITVCTNPVILPSETKASPKTINPANSPSLQSVVLSQRQVVDSPAPSKTISSRHLVVPCYSEDEGTCDDLSTVDWTEAELSASELKLLGMPRYRVLMKCGVDTLSLPSMYEKGECAESRIQDWLSRVEPVKEGSLEAPEMTTVQCSS